MITDLQNLSVRCWLVILGCVAFLAWYAYLSKGDCDG